MRKKNKTFKIPRGAVCTFLRLKTLNISLLPFPNNGLGSVFWPQVVSFEARFQFFGVDAVVLPWVPEAILARAIELYFFYFAPRDTPLGKAAIALIAPSQWQACLYTFLQDFAETRLRRSLIGHRPTSAGLRPASTKSCREKTSGTQGTVVSVHATTLKKKNSVETARQPNIELSDFYCSTFMAIFWYF